MSKDKISAEDFQGLKDLFDKFDNVASKKEDSTARRRQLFWETNEDMVKWEDRAVAKAAANAKPMSTENYRDCIALVVALTRSCPSVGFDHIHIMVENLLGWGENYNNHITPGDDFVVTPEDGRRADAICEYFSNKFVMKRLEGKDLSEWEAAVSFIVNNRSSLQRGDISKIVKIGTIYDNNLFYDDLEATHVTAEGKDSVFQKFVGDLEFIEVKNINYSRRKVAEFWFRDPQTDYLLCHTAPIDNQLTHIFEWVCKSNKYINVEAFLNKSHLRGSNFQYFTIANFDIKGSTPWNQHNT